ncbi:MAG: hypothetical protein VW916_07270 [Flavobacteriaceae bacterium]|jgi:hypothetical protein
MLKIYFLKILIFLSFNSVLAQWNYELDIEKNEKISVKDFKNESTFSIHKLNQGDVNFFIELELDKDCEINEVVFEFDGVKQKINFKVKSTGEKNIEIFYDEFNGLEGLEVFSLYIKKRNTLNITFLDKCGLNKSKKYTLKGSSNAIDKIELMEFLKRNINILSAKKEKFKYLVSQIPRLENNKLLEQRLDEINILDIKNISWKSHNNDRYNITLMLILESGVKKQLFGKFKLLNPVKIIKSRY